MSRFTKTYFPVMAAFLLFLSCSHPQKKFVSIKYVGPKADKSIESILTKITVNDFTDVRDDKERVGVDYTSATDLMSVEPVGIVVAQVMGEILSRKGYEIMRISRDDAPLEYVSEFDADYHLTGKLEELMVKVKRKGMLANFDSRGRIHFSLYNREGKVVWAGRMRAEYSASKPFKTEKAIEESLNEAVKLLGINLVNDDKFINITEKR